MIKIGGLVLIFGTFHRATLQEWHHDHPARNKQPEHEADTRGYQVLAERSFPPGQGTVGPGLWGAGRAQEPPRVRSASERCSSYHDTRLSMVCLSDTFSRSFTSFTDTKSIRYKPWNWKYGTLELLIICCQVSVRPFLLWGMVLSIEALHCWFELSIWTLFDVSYQICCYCNMRRYLG